MDLTYTQKAHLDISVRGSSTQTCMRYPQWIFDECGCGPLRGGEQPVHRHQSAELSLRETTALVKVNPNTTCSRSLISLTWSLKPPTLHPLMITAGIEEAHCLCFQPAASGLRFASIGLVFVGMLTFSRPLQSGKRFQALHMIFANSFSRKFMFTLFPVSLLKTSFASDAIDNLFSLPVWFIERGKSHNTQLPTVPSFQSCSAGQSWWFIGYKCIKMAAAKCIDVY